MRKTLLHILAGIRHFSLLCIRIWWHFAKAAHRPRTHTCWKSQQVPLNERWLSRTSSLTFYQLKLYQTPANITGTEKQMWQLAASLTGYRLDHLVLCLAQEGHVKHYLAVLERNLRVGAVIGYGFGDAVGKKEQELNRGTFRYGLGACASV